LNQIKIAEVKKMTGSGSPPSALVFEPAPDIKTATSILPPKARTF
jgi:hypothetical protein